MNELIYKLENTYGLKVHDYNLKWEKPLVKSRSETEYIILHQAMWHECSIRQIHSDHIIHRGWRGVGYNFLVRKNGTIELGRPIGMITAHCKEERMNYKSIGVCFEGNFDDYNVQPIDYKMNDKQYEAGVKLLKALTKELDIKTNNIRPHNYYAKYKKCTGKYFPLTEMLGDVMRVSYEHWALTDWKYLNSEGVVIHDKRFEDVMKRGEVIALVRRMYDKLREGK